MVLHGLASLDAGAGVVVHCTVFGRQVIDVQLVAPLRSTSKSCFVASTDNALVVATIIDQTSHTEPLRTVARVGLEVVGGRFVNGQQCRLMVRQRV